MIIHNAFRIADNVSLQSRESPKNTFSPDGNDFAATLALFSGNGSSDQRPGSVESRDIHRTANGTDRKDSAARQAHEAHQGREARDASPADRGKTEDEKSSSGAVRRDKQDAVQKDGNSVKKGTAGGMSKKKLFFKIVKGSTDKSRMGKTVRAAGISVSRAKMPRVKTTEDAGSQGSLREKNRAQSRRDIKGRLRLHDNRDKSGKRIAVSQKVIKAGTRLPFMQDSVKNIPRTAKTSKARKKIKAPHIVKQAKMFDAGRRQKTESVLFGHRQDAAKVRKDSKVGDTVSAVIKYEHSAQNVGMKTHYQFQKIADGNFDEIIKQFTLVLNRGGGEARLHLHPESLGELKLSIKLSNNNVSTNILVEHQFVKDLIMERLNVLAESLQEHGFQLGSFQVEVKDRQNDSYEVFNGTKRGTAAVTVDDDELLTDNAMSAVPPWMSTLINITV